MQQRVREMTNFIEILHPMFSFSLSTTTLVWLVVIGCAAVANFVYARRLARQNALDANRRKVEQIPSLLSTLGVLGTFYGITEGLVGFDSSDLNTSIPLLLNGLKTAFFTSLAGMISSLVLSRYLTGLYDKQSAEEGKPEEELGHLLKELVGQQKSEGEFRRAMLDTMSAIKEQTGALTELPSALSSLKLSVGNIEEKTAEQTAAITASIKDLARYTAETADASTSMESVAEEIAEEVKSFDRKLHAETVEIEDKMTEINRLLSDKFDLFADLLQKSNTEALVEVMKRVTEEFQQSMNELISRLVAENFEQLNTSVARLNSWQQENKQMIADLTDRYRQTAEAFTTSAEALAEVSHSTQTLVADGGRLAQLVETLQKVMVDDERFAAITTDLSATVTLTRENMTRFDTATQSLNEWVRKQRNFVDGVQLLIEKLDELNRMRDYNDQFWQSTKQSLEQGVGIISAGSAELNRQITRLDERFYARLSTTLAELDACIEAMLKKR